jgi:hypothetical protein
MNKTESKSEIHVLSRTTPHKTVLKKQDPEHAVYAGAVFFL